MVGEASYTLSGFGTYSREVLYRLFKTGKYDIAELASYGHVNDARDKMPWRIYPNAIDPREGQDPRLPELNSKPINQFGAWRFDRVCLDFKPDFVVDIRDPWMLMFENQSPLRRFFNWVIMPTVDSAPQQEEWIQHFIEADGVFTYSDWGLETLRKEGGVLINLISSAPPGVNLSEYKPNMNTLEHKRKMFMRDEINIIGTVMRNQRRKLYPELMLAFKLFLKKCHDEGNHKLAENTFLYFHTSYPDVTGCWNIPRLLKENGLGNKVFFSYLCKNCGTVFASLFQDVKTVCPNCNTVSAILPSVGAGLSTTQLNDIYNLFDVYVQYANCEGFGMPQVEAASAGVPVMSTDYSAMSDVVRKLKGYPIKVERMYRVVEEDAYKALPENKDLAEKLYKFLSLPHSERRQKGLDARRAVEEHYTWDKTTKIWEKYFDETELTGLQGKWDAPPEFLQPSATLDQIPQNIDNQQFVEWIFTHLHGDSSLGESLLSMDMVRALNYEVVVQSNNVPYTRQHAVDKVTSMITAHNQCEQVRCGMVNLPPEDYIEYAHRRPA